MNYTIQFEIGPTCIPEEQILESSQRKYIQMVSKEA